MPSENAKDAKACKCEFDDAKDPVMWTIEGDAEHFVLVQKMRDDTVPVANHEVDFQKWICSLRMFGLVCKALPKSLMSAISTCNHHST